MADDRWHTKMSDIVRFQANYTLRQAVIVDIKLVLGFCRFQEEAVPALQIKVYWHKNIHCGAFPLPLKLFLQA